MLISARDPEAWISLLCESGAHPAPDLLRAQFLAGKVSEKCDCGCASFGMAVPAESEVDPLSPPGRSGLAFEADFRISGSDRTIEVFLMVNELGNLSYVEVDCCGNAYPVPASVRVELPAYHVDLAHSAAF